MTDPQQRIVVCALYHFVRLDDYEALQAPLMELMRTHGVKGTLLLANEGINGTIAGTREGIDAVLAWLRQDQRHTEACLEQTSQRDRGELRRAGKGNFHAQA